MQDTNCETSEARVAQGWSRMARGRPISTGTVVPKFGQFRPGSIACRRLRQTSAGLHPQNLYGVRSGTSIDQYGVRNGVDVVYCVRENMLPSPVQSGVVLWLSE